MKITIRNLPYDILLSQIWAVIALSSLLINTHPFIQIIIGLPIILIIPGYLLLLILFPKNTNHQDIKGIERLIYSCGISLAILSLLGLLLFYSPWGLNPQSIYLAIFIIVLTQGIISYIFYHRTSDDEPYFLTFTIKIFHNKTLYEKILTIIFISLVLITSTFFIYLTSFNQRDQPLTEFYLFDETGSLTHYPKKIGYTEDVTGIVGISNHEFKTIDYTIGIWLINQSSMDIDSQNISSQNTEKIWFLGEKNITLPHTNLITNTSWKPQWQYPFSIPIQKTGRFQIHFMLYKNKTKLLENKPLMLKYPEMIQNLTNQQLSLNIEIGNTEFVFLNQTQSTIDAKTNITLGKNILGLIGLSNHEFSTKNYTLDLWLVLLDNQSNTTKNLTNKTCSKMWFIQRNTYPLNHTDRLISNTNQPQIKMNYSIPTNSTGNYLLIATLNNRSNELYNQSINYCEMIEKIIEKSYKILINYYNVI